MSQPPPVPRGDNSSKPLRIDPNSPPPEMLDKMSQMTGRPIRMPLHAQMIQAGVPQEFVEGLKEAARSGNGYMIALWKLEGPVAEDKPLPSFRVMRTCVRYPTALLLESITLLLRNIIEQQMGGAVRNVQIEPLAPANEAAEPKKEQPA